MFCALLWALVRLDNVAIAPRRCSGQWTFQSMYLGGVYVSWGSSILVLQTGMWQTLQIGCWDSWPFHSRVRMVLWRAMYLSRVFWSELGVSASFFSSICAVVVPSGKLLVIWFAILRGEASRAISLVAAKASRSALLIAICMVALLRL